MDWIKSKAKGYWWRVGLIGIGLLLCSVCGWAGDIIGVCLDGSDISQSKVIWNDLPRNRDVGLKKILEFFAAFPVNETDWWVNLSPKAFEYEIVGDSLKTSLLGPRLVKLDLQLKRDVQRLIAELDELSVGDVDWQTREGLVRFWIVPEKIEVDEGPNFIVIRKIRFDVKFESAFPSLNRVIQQNVLPELKKKVNNDPAYHDLFSICSYAVLARWCREKGVNWNLLVGLESLWSKRSYLDRFLELFSYDNEISWISGGIFLPSKAGQFPIESHRRPQLPLHEKQNQRKVFDYLSAGMFRVVLPKKGFDVSSDQAQILVKDPTSKSERTVMVKSYFLARKDNLSQLRAILGLSKFSDSLLDNVFKLFSQVWTETGWKYISIYRIPSDGHDIFGAVTVPHGKAVIVFLSEDLFLKEELTPLGAYVLLHELLHAIFRAGYVLRYYQNGEKSEKLVVVKKKSVKELLSIEKSSLTKNNGVDLFAPYRKARYKKMQGFVRREQFVTSFLQILLTKYGTKSDWLQFDWYIRLYQGKQLDRVEELSDGLAKLNALLERLDCPLKRRIIILSTVYSHPKLRNRIGQVSSDIFSFYSALFPGGSQFPKTPKARRAFWRLVEEGLLRNVNRWDHDHNKKLALDFLQTIKNVFELDQSQIEDPEIYVLIQDYIIVAPSLARLWLKMYEELPELKLKSRLESLLKWYTHSLVDGMFTEHSEELKQVKKNRMVFFVDGKEGSISLLDEELVLNSEEIKKLLQSLVVVRTPFTETFFSLIQSTLDQITIRFIPFIIRSQFVFREGNTLIMPISFLAEDGRSLTSMGKIALFHGVIELLIEKGQTLSVAESNLSKQEMLLYKYAQKMGVREKALFFDWLILGGERLWNDFIAVMQLWTGRFKHAVFWPFGREKVKKLRDELVKQGEEGLIVDFIDTSLHKTVDSGEFRICRTKALRLLDEILSGESWLEELFREQVWFQDYKQELRKVCNAVKNWPDFLKSGKLLAMFLSLADLLKWRNLPESEEFDQRRKEQLQDIINVALKLCRYPLRVSWEIVFKLHSRWCSPEHSLTVQPQKKGGVLVGH